MSYSLVVLLLVASSACVGPVRVGLLPRTPAPPPDDPAATLVTDPEAQRDRADVAPALRTPLADSAGLSLASVLLWLASGERPLLGFFGSFDENRLVETPRPNAGRGSRGSPRGSARCASCGE